MSTLRKFIVLIVALLLAAFGIGLQIVASIDRKIMCFISLTLL